jgi:thioredoxin-related protein
MKSRWKLAAMVLTLAGILMAGWLDVTAKQPSSTGNGIQWSSYTEGLRRGKAENKKLLLSFHADWCRYCLKMEKETFQDSTVIAYLNRHFIPVSVDLESAREIAARYNVKGLPSTWFLSENGGPICSRPGYIPPDEMLNILRYIGSDSYLSMSYKSFLEKSPPVK